MVRVHADPARHLHQIELSSTSPEKMNQPPVRRTQVYLLMLLFFGPLLGAVLLYFVFPQWQPQSRTNYGELINPARPAPDDLRLQRAEAKPGDRKSVVQGTCGPVVLDIGGRRYIN